MVSERHQAIQGGVDRPHVAPFLATCAHIRRVQQIVGGHADLNVARQVGQHLGLVEPCVTQPVVFEKRYALQQLQLLDKELPLRDQTYLAHDRGESELVEGSIRLDTDVDNNYGHEVIEDRRRF